MLEELVAVIQTLKSRIEAHRVILQANETRTRVSLIDPLLCALEWDTADPGLVTLEYDIQGKRADYGLLSSDGDALVFLEAKRLGESLSNHRSQVVAYASEVGIRYPALTDGDQWEVYDNSKLVPIADRRILNLSVAQDPTPNIALQLLLLWRANMESGSPQPAQEPIVPMESEPKSASKSTSPPAAQTTKIPALSSNKSDTEEGWTKLADFQTVSGTKPPPEIWFANGEKADTRYWSWVLGEIADYLARNGLLKSGDCPLTTGTTTNRYLVNTSPMYFDGTKFHNQRRLSNGLYLDTGFSAHDCVRFGRYLLEHFDQDPSQVWLKTG